MTRVAIALGSNLGDRLGHLQEAVKQLRNNPLLEVVAVSAVYETEPVGGPDQDEFFNAVAIVNTQVSPEELLDAMQEIENAQGRTREIHWGPRTLDVDILAMGSLVMNSERLELPHPRAHERGFVLIPWAQVDPNFELPLHGRVADLAVRVRDSGIERIFEADVFNDRNQDR